MKKILILIAVILVVGCQNKKEEVKSCCSTNKSLIAAQETVLLPDNSVYNLDRKWQNQNGEKVSLAKLSGSPVIMTMIFTHCEYACPMMVNDLKKIEASFSEVERDRFRFVLVSFDDQRDTPKRLKDYAEVQNLGKNWILLHGDAEQVKELSVILQISYNKLEDGSFSHANRKLVLDQNGIIVFGQDGLQANSWPVVGAIRNVF
ncbi:MAG: hypothetical protein CVT92_04040 [Bacteroidetes bacterium HGW-Bacteroidetes-1]|jgi:protein SCO1/2|nr:MAG: hypothetical protein CVT92_04040 [Bacteroidetes bacterium HGW-Bacteroidetes-1]